MRSPKVFLGLASLIALYVSCSDSTPAPVVADGGGDAPVVADGSDVTDVVATPDNAPPVMCSPRSFETGSAEGDATPLTVPMGGVRAGRLEASELPTSRTGLAYWKTGDYVLANERVALLVEGARPSDGYNLWGGGPVGVARVEGGRLVDAGDFNEMMFGLGRYTVATDSVTVMSNGSNGTATVRASGPMRAIPFIDAFGRTLVPANYDDVNLAVDYELRPGNDYVDVYATFDVRNPDGYTAEFVTNAFFQGYRMGRFFTGTGFVGTGDGNAPPESQSILWVDDEATSWAWRIPTGNLSQFISVSGFDLFTAPGITLPGCAAPLTRVPIGRIVIGGRGLDGLQQAVARMNSTTLREIRGTVMDASGMPAVGVRVHASRSRMVTVADAGAQTVHEELTRATTDAMGAFAIHVPMGMAVDLRAYRRGDAVAGPTTVAASETMATLRLAATGNIHVVATETGSMTALPVRVQVLPVGAEVPSVPGTFGEVSMPSGRLHVDFPTNGDITLRAPPGRYRVVVSRGYEYELSDTMVTVTAGMNTEVPVSLRRSVDTANVQCGDFHIHTTRSPDSRDPARFKLASAAADGLEVPARSDHEYTNEWSTTIREMGLERWMYGITSLEFTTFAWGHFGVVPLTPDPAQRNGGIFNWPNRLPPAVFAEVRARPENPVLIINHPRGTAISGYFTAAGYNRMTGVAARPDMWDDTFTAVEVFNDKSFYDSDNEESVQDWFSFLQRGRRVFAVGSSDTHSVLGGSPVGYPRTCMFVGSDDPRVLTPAAVRDTLRAGRSYISGGIYVEATAAPATGGTTTAGPGQELRGLGAMARLSVRVQAPAWITADRLEIYVNGAIAQTIALDMSRRDPMNPTIRFRGDVMVPVPATNGWVIAAVRGGSLEPVHPGRNAFGVTNPIFLVR